MNSRAIRVTPLTQRSCVGMKFRGFLWAASLVSLPEIARQKKAKQDCPAPLECARWDLDPPRLVLAVAYLQVGLGVCISDRVASAALCHSQARKACRPGNYLVVLRAWPSPKARPPKYAARLGVVRRFVAVLLV